MNIRQKLLLDRLCRSGRVQIEVEAANFAVSGMTIRRDLRLLAQAGQVILTPGGAVPARAGGPVLSAAAPSEAQKRIAGAALKVIRGASTIMLSVGATTLELARQLAVSDLRLTVVTNSLPIASALFQTEIQVLLTGGSLRMQSLDLVGPITEKNLGEFHIDVLFSGCDGADAAEGFFTTDLNLAAMERKSVEISERVVVVTESSKFRKKSLAKFASLAEVATVVTDRQLAAIDRQRLTEHQVELIIV